MFTFSETAQIQSSTFVNLLQHVAPASNKNNN